MKIGKQIPRHPLGLTGELVSLLGVGGYAIGIPSDIKIGIRIIRSAIDNGVNFLDNAWDYHNGRSEKIMGKALKDGYREKVILMTKNHGRDYDTYKKQLEDSLSRLQTDYIDILQFHEIIHEGEPDRIFSEGAIDAAMEAKKEGKIRFIGFTGHKYPSLFKEMLKKNFDWDTVQMPINMLDYHYKSFTKQILPILKERKIGVIGMKSLTGGGVLNIRSLKPEECIRYSMSQSIATLVSGMDSLEVLKKNLIIASNFSPMSGQETNALLKRSKSFIKDAKYEWYKR
jgi:predicted aldo/keto reductase-like oxidoreductase